VVVAAQGLCKVPLRCLVLLKARVFPSSSSSNSIVVYYSSFCRHFSDARFGFGKLLDNLRGHLFFFNFSFNFEALGLNVEGCCG
jgi:hypothetical protein